MCSTSTLFLPCVLCVHVLLIVSTVSASSSGRLIAVTAKYHVRTRIPVSILASIRRTHTHTHARTPPQTSHIHATRSPWALFLANMGLTHFTTKNDSVQFNSHLFLSPIRARTLKMPVPYPPPNVGAYTRTPSHQPLVFGRKGIDHLP